MSTRLTTAQKVLNQAVPEVRDQLSQFISTSNFANQIALDQWSELAPNFLGTPQQGNNAQEVINQWINSEGTLPEIEIVPSASINGAQGAYAAKTNQIFLAQEFLIENQNYLDAVEKVLLEELGHSFSNQINSQDLPGDEGAIFSKLITGEEISPETLAELLREDDTATIVLNNEKIQIEQASEGKNSAFDLIGLTELRNDPNFKDIDGTGFDVAIIDVGLDKTHPLLDGNYKSGIDYVDGDDNPNDLQNHGTHVAGTVGAEDKNIGVAPDVGLIGLKVAENRNVTDGQAIADALQEVLDQVRDPQSKSNIAAINLSLGGGFYTNPNEPNSEFDIKARELIQELESEGVVVVTAAGNSYEGKPDSKGAVIDANGDLINPNQQQNVSTPAIYSTIAVGAVWQDDVAPDSLRRSQIPGADRVAVFSQRLDSGNFMFAPGALITSTIPQKDDGTQLGKLAGTSQAAPHVTGSVALLQEIAGKYDVRLTTDQVRDYLINNADTVKDGDDEADGVTNTNLEYPRINIHQSAIALREDLENGSLGDASAKKSSNPAKKTKAKAAVDLKTSSSDLETLMLDESWGSEGNFENTSDLDFFLLTAPDSGTLEIDLDSAEDIFPDGYLRLFNQDGQELFFTSDDQEIASEGKSFAPRGGLLEIELEVGTEYYLGINNYGDDVRDYSLAEEDTASEHQEGDDLFAISEMLSFRPMADSTTSPIDQENNSLDNSLSISPVMPSELEVASGTLTVAG